MKYSSSSPLSTPLTSVLYFSWLKDRKTYWADNASLPLSLYELTSNGKETGCCSPKSVFVSFGQRSFSARCMQLMSLPFMSSGSRDLQSFASESVFFSCICSVLKVVHNQSQESGLQSPSTGYLSDLVAYACIAECSVTSSGRRNTVHIDHNIYKFVRQYFVIHTSYLSCE